MIQQRLYEWIKHPESLNRETLYELRTLLAHYPYFQTARLLYLKNLYLLHDITFGDEEKSFTKESTILEEIAYRDTWGKGADSFISIIYEHLVLMRGLLAEDGSIFVHCDWRVSGYLRLVLDEVFGKENFINEITWKRTFAHGDMGQVQLLCIFIGDNFCKEFSFFNSIKFTIN